MRPIRVIHDPPLAGAMNMAVDEWLLEQTGLDQQPRLRFYQWAPATLSLGYFQRRADREHHSASLTLPMVRRTTGGGAIVHDRELTYSLTFPLSDRWAARHRELYDLMHRVIITALADWGISVRSWQSGDPVPPTLESTPFLCFQRRSAGDLVGGLHKVVGSAQRRSERALLQHGSLLLGCSPYAPELPGLVELGGIAVPPGQLSRRIEAGFCQETGSFAEPEDPDWSHQQGVEKWLRSRYLADSWNGKR